MRRRALVVAAAILVGAACSSERERRSALAGTVTAGALSQWELVYDRDVGGNVDL